MGIDTVCCDCQILDWLTHIHFSTRRTASVCSGASLLASAKLLDGKQATSHWHRLKEFKEKYPKVDWKDDAIFVRSDKIWTSAGITSGIDMALAMIEEDLGFAMAKAIARQLVVYLRRPGGQSQFSTLLDLSSEDERFNRLNEWIKENLSKPLTLSILAQKMNMSERSFYRHYSRITGYSPAKAIALIRVEDARHYLESKKTMKQIVVLCSFGSEETFRRVFHKHLGISPSA
ncbi:GlxA family transcriptional regulator [Bartonella tamiae]|nr:helix-turn-helix domain-containing protein [Bartonella tamiae]